MWFFSGEKNKNIIYFLSAKVAQRVHVFMVIWLHVQGIFLRLET